MPQKNDIGPCTMPVTYLPRHVTSRPACAVARFQPRPTSASGQTRSFGDVGFDVRFARKRTNRQSTPWSTAILAEIYLLKLEAAVRVGGAFLAGGDAAALTKAITATAAQFFVEVAAKGDKQEALKRSGLTYLLRLRQFHDSRS